MRIIKDKKLMKILYMMMVPNTINSGIWSWWWNRYFYVILHPPKSWNFMKVHLCWVYFLIGGSGWHSARFTCTLIITAECSHKFDSPPTAQEFGCRSTLAVLLPFRVLRFLLQQPEIRFLPISLSCFLLSHLVLWDSIKCLSTIPPWWDPITMTTSIL